MWSATASYLVAVLAAQQWARGAGAWRVALLLLPVVCVAWLIGLIVLRARQLDEYQRQLLLPGLVTGFALSMLTALTLGALHEAGLTVPSSGWPVALVGIFGWEFTNVLVKAPIS